jgi:BirA family transcriptional regulator, biotin operon repressor / biotin---[acetyl-CoA-carboxylase] ligase
MAAEIHIGIPLIRLEQVSSTNDYAAQLIRSGNAPEGTAILAEYQTTGRGQKGNLWESEKGKNLTFSFILLPEGLEVSGHFYLLMSISLAIRDLLRTKGINAGIKWPNDIFAADRKIGGILIENTIKGGVIASSVAGIGLNVNQTDFAFKGRLPTSMKNELGVDTSCEALLEESFMHLTHWVNMLYKREWEGMRENYMQSLFRFNCWSDYADSAGHFKGRIAGILEGGELVVEREDGRYRNYGFKDIEYRF